jgi:hypothetical protein
MFSVYKLAGELNALVFSHVRDPDIISIQEVIADAALTGAPLHIVHINSMALGQIQLALDMNNQQRTKDWILQQNYILTQPALPYCKVLCSMMAGSKKLNYLIW